MGGMGGLCGSPRYPQGMTDWITDRLPTADDAEDDDAIDAGDVRVQRQPDRSPTRVWNYTNYRLVVPGQPWWSFKAQAKIDAAKSAAAKSDHEMTRCIDSIQPAQKILEAAAKAEREIFIPNADEIIPIPTARKIVQIAETSVKITPTPTARKIVQVVEASTGLLYALCDDGSLWFSANDEDSPWFRRPSIPQGDDA